MIRKGCQAIVCLDVICCTFPTSFVVFWKPLSNQHFPPPKNVHFVKICQWLFPAICLHEGWQRRPSKLLPPEGGCWKIWHFLGMRRTDSGQIIGYWLLLFKVNAMTWQSQKCVDYCHRNLCLSISTSHLENITYGTDQAKSWAELRRMLRKWVWELRWRLHGGRRVGWLGTGGWGEGATELLSWSPALQKIQIQTLRYTLTSRYECRCLGKYFVRHKLGEEPAERKE